MKIKNWEKFQHFKDRRPPWIKLYRDILDDIEWHNLSGDAAKSLVMLWLIASEDSGTIPAIKQIAFRLRITEQKANALLSTLSHWLRQDDISAISEGYQSDAPETEREAERETEREAENIFLKDQKKEPKPLTDIQKVVTVFKLAQGVEKNDTDWDKVYFGRFTKPAKDLLLITGGWPNAGNCVQDVYERLTAKGLTVTLDTILRHATEWRKDNLEKEVKHGILPVPSNGNSETN